jgi:hypothetical protein
LWPITITTAALSSSWRSRRSSRGGEIKRILVKNARRVGEAGQCEFGGLAGAQGGRAQHQIEVAERLRQAVADQPRLLAAARAQLPVGILDARLPAGLGVPQQVQPVHRRCA